MILLFLIVEMNLYGLELIGWVLNLDWFIVLIMCFGIIFIMVKCLVNNVNGYLSLNLMVLLFIVFMFLMKLINIMNKDLFVGFIIWLYEYIIFFMVIGLLLWKVVFLWIVIC